MINKLRDFLVEHKALEEFILSVEDLYDSKNLDNSWRGIISGLFTWTEAENELGTLSDWNYLDNLWLDACNNEDSVPYLKDEFLAKLRVPNKKRRLLNAIKDFR